MLRMLLGRAVLILLPSAGLAQTFVVDVNSGPGTQFTSIATAVATVPSGSVLQVRQGVYVPFTIAGKGLTILGEAGVEVVGPWFGLTDFAVTGTSPSQAVVVRDVSLRSSYGGPVQVRCQACQGPVFLQRVAMDESFYQGIPRELSVQNCSQMLVDHCGPFRGTNIGGTAIAVVASDVVFTGCAIPQTLGYGMHATNSTLHVVDGSIAAGWGTAAAIWLSGSTLRLATTTVTVLGLSQAFVLAGPGTVVNDSGTTLVGTVASTITLVTQPQGLVRSTGGALGTIATAAMEGPPGHLGLLCLGSLGTPMALAGFQYEAWLANGAVVVAAGVFGPPLTRSVFVPANPLLLGSVFAWQGASFDPGTGFALSNPSLFTP